MLKSLPDTPERAQQELMFLITLGMPLTAQELAEQLLSLARRQQDLPHLVIAHQALGGVLFWRGELAPARAQLEQSMALYQPQQHRAMAASYGLDYGVVGYYYAAWVVWSLGYPDQARQRSRAALTLAREGAHPYTLAFALHWAATLQMFLREGQATQEWPEATISHTSEHGFPLYLAFSTSLRGSALARQGQGAEGIGQIHQGLDAYRATGAALGWPWHFALLAEAYQHAGQTAAGLAALAEALTAVHKTGERVYEAELYRLKGELLLQSRVQSLETDVLAPDAGPQTLDAEAEGCFRQALAVARQQQAKSWELRTATSLSRLWQQQGRRVEAYELLASIYDWFTEGFDTADLQEARALLEALG